MVHDMTVGSPTKHLIKFMVPFFLGALLQQLYGTVDSLIVGRLLGADALAAVGASTNIFHLVTSGAVGAMTGFSSITAKKVGTKDPKGIRDTFFVSIVLMLALSVIVTALGFLLYKPLLAWANTPAEIFDDACGYIFVILTGTVFTMLYNLLAGEIRAMGNSKFPFYVLLISSVVNIALDILFITALPMGVRGAALATVISQAVACVLCAVIILRKFPELHLTKADCCFQANIAGACLKVGIPMFLQSSLISGGGLIGQSARNTFGTATIVAFSTLMRFFAIVMSAYSAIGAAMLTYVNQNMGAGYTQRVYSGIKIGCLIAAIMGLAAAAGVLLFGKGIVWLFVGNSEMLPEIMYRVSLYLPFLAPGLFMCSFIEPIRNALHGVGMSFVPVFAVGQELATRSLFSFLAIHTGSYTVVCIAEPLTWTFSLIPLSIGLIIWYRKNRKASDK